jgi:hypothetical protein
MTKEEKKRLSVVLRATEYLFLENIAAQAAARTSSGCKLAEAARSPAVSA